MARPTLPCKFLLRQRTLPVHRRTCIRHICTHTRSHAPSANLLLLFVWRLYPTPLPRPISIQYSVTWRPTSSLSPCTTSGHLLALGPISVFVSRYTWYECAAGIMGERNKAKTWLKKRIHLRDRTKDTIMFERSWLGICFHLPARVFFFILHSHFNPIVDSQHTSPHHGLKVKRFAKAAFGFISETGKWHKVQNWWTLYDLQSDGTT